jgi:lysozyme family protein
MTCAVFFTYCPGRRKAAFLLEHIMTAEQFSNEDLRFQACLAFTLKYEGGRSNDPHDPGGPTMEGVTQATYDAYRAIKARGRGDVFMIGAAERDEIYRKEYWDRIKGDGLLPGEDLCVFDLAVNSGPMRASGIRAKILAKPGISTDQLIHKMCAYRLSFLHALPTWRYFGAGWGRRVAACEATAIRMAYGKAAPEILAKRANKARHDSGKKASQATVGTAVTGSAWLVHYLHGGGSIALTVGVALASVIVGIFFFHAWRHRQRADALGAAIAAIKAEHEMLEQKTKAAIAEVELAGKEADKKTQEFVMAQKAISELGIKAGETKI